MFRQDKGQPWRPGKYCFFVTAHRREGIGVFSRSRSTAVTQPWVQHKTTTNHFCHPAAQTLLQQIPAERPHV